MHYYSTGSPFYHERTTWYEPTYIQPSIISAPISSTIVEGNTSLGTVELHMNNPYVIFAILASILIAIVILAVISDYSKRNTRNARNQQNQQNAQTSRQTRSNDDYSKHAFVSTHTTSQASDAGIQKVSYANIPTSPIPSAPLLEEESNSFYKNSPPPPYSPPMQSVYEGSNTIYVKTTNNGDSELSETGVFGEKFSQDSVFDRSQTSVLGESLSRAETRRFSSSTTFGHN
ncbi:hypothetical protein NEIRO03_0643 [Nematocida sp. AWRm78]|nr:hypothetical protein NEIRO02_0896 [Nematocida sp. AWRm79]KAI5183016.1 hypothetical protein NEIRO03_0643 [Nematocida sp. AWRm78]